jgi:WD40 repeat protein
MKIDAYLPTRVVFSPDGGLLVGATYDTIRIWDAMTGNEIGGPLTGHTEAVSAISISSDAERIASSSFDNTLRVWDARTGANIVGPLKFACPVFSVAFSGDGKQIVSGSSDQTIRVWDAESGRLLQGPLCGHQDCVMSVAFSLDATIIVSASRRDGDVCIWNTETGDLVSGPSQRQAPAIHTVASHSSYPMVAISPNGKWIGVCLGEVFQVRNLQTGRVVMTFDTYHTIVGTLTFSPDSKRVLWSCHDNTVRVHTLVA